MSDNKNESESADLCMSERIESIQADKTSRTVLVEELRVDESSKVSGLKNELFGERVMRRSATTTREVKLPLSFRTLDTREVFSTTGLLDSGDTDSFIDKGMIDQYGLKVEILDKPIPVLTLTEVEINSAILPVT